MVGKLQGAAMKHSSRFSSDQLAHLEALRAYVAQVRGDDDFRGDPRIVDQGRALISRATALGLPVELCREVQAIVRSYDAEADRPPEHRAAWFKQRRPLTPAEKHRDFLAIVERVLLRYGSPASALIGTAGSVEAALAAYRIPADVTATDAALEFCGFAVRGPNGDAPAGRAAAMAHDIV